MKHEIDVVAAKPEPKRVSLGISVEELDEWVNRSPQLSQDSHNRDLFIAWIKQNPNGSIYDLANWATGNRQLHWLESNEPKKLKGTSSDRLYQVGVRKDPRLSASEQRAEDEKRRKEIEASAQHNRDIVAEKDRARAIRDAEHFKVFRPDGRIDHAASQEGRRKKLAALGIVK